MPEWEARDAAVQLEKRAGVIEGVLAKLKPEEWVRLGAPEAYIDQLTQTRKFTAYLGAQAQNLQREPGKLSVVLDTFLRLDHLQLLLDSIIVGARRYQNAALADLLGTTIIQNSTTRELLMEYTRQLAGEREKEWEVANAEAQRCRVSLSKKPPAAVAAPGKKAAAPGRP